MKLTLLPVLLTLTTLAASAPLGSRTGSALEARQTGNAGSTSTSTSNNSNTLFGGLTSCMSSPCPDTRRDKESD